jgi:pantothenate kinase
MKKETAAEVLRIMIDCGGQLNRSVQVVKGSSSNEEFRRYRSIIAKIMTDMLIGIMNPIVAEHPELKPKEMK